MAEGLKHHVPRRYRWMMYVCVAGLWFCGGALGIYAADNEMPVMVRTAEAATPIVSPGGELRIEYTLERRRSCEVWSDRFVVDARKVRFELPDLNIKAGLPLGPDHYIVPVEVKPEAAPGPAFYRTVTSYRCNPLQWIFPINGGTRDIPFIIRAPP